MSDLHDTLAELQYRRKFTIKQHARAHNAARALIRRAMGWNWDLPEEERMRLNKRAAALFAAMRSGTAIGEADREIAESLALDIQAYGEMIAPLEARRVEIERDMERLAKQTSLWTNWAVDVRGFGARGLAVILGEAGDPLNYPNPDKLKRRMACAPYDGRAGSTWRVPSWRPSTPSADDWSRWGYAPARYAQLYGVVLVPLMQSQRPAAEYDAETGEITREADPYRAVYDRARARFADRAERPIHGHKHGLRVMGQELLIDLWRVAHGQEPRRKGAEPECELVLSA